MTDTTSLIPQRDCIESQSSHTKETLPKTSTGAIKFKVGICGGGIGGLVTALALAKYPDIEVTVYESASQFTQVGAGFAFSLRPWKILESLGLGADLLEKCPDGTKTGPDKPYRYRKSDQAEGFEFFSLTYGGPMRFFHRADFQEVLLKHLKTHSSTRIYCSKRLQKYNDDSSGPIELLFEDGSTSTCDILIGADGLKSAVRGSLLRGRAAKAKELGLSDKADELLDVIDAKFSGTNCYRALIHGDVLRASAPDHQVLKSPTHWVGKNGHIVSYPLRDGELINIAAFRTHCERETTVQSGNHMAIADKSELLDAFSGWEPDALTLLTCVDKLTKWAINVVGPLDSFVADRVALIGDAAHAMLPTQASGAGQSIEDAYLLSTLLGHPSTTTDTLPRALAIYDQIRRPFSQGVVERSHISNMYVSLDGLSLDGLDDDVKWEKLQELGRAMKKNFEWTWETSIDKDMERAINLLERGS